jgi:hypothetical protein
MTSKRDEIAHRSDETRLSTDDEVANKSDVGSASDTSHVFDVKQIDPVLARKMALVNAAIDEIGMTKFQWKLFWLNGFGYAVDSVCVRQTI